MVLIEGLLAKDKTLLNIFLENLADYKHPKYGFWVTASIFVIFRLTTFVFERV